MENFCQLKINLIIFLFRLTAPVALFFLFNCISLIFESFGAAISQSFTFENDKITSAIKKGVFISFFGIFMLFPFWFVCVQTFLSIISTNSQFLQFFGKLVRIIRQDEWDSQFSPIIEQIYVLWRTIAAKHSIQLPRTIISAFAAVVVNLCFISALEYE